MIQTLALSTRGIIVDLHEQVADPTAIQNAQQGIAIFEFVEVFARDGVDLSQAD
jgi:hypothetical protein